MSHPFAPFLAALACSLLLFSPATAADPPDPSPTFAPKFFAFENGLPFPPDQQAAVLKDLGFHGIGSARPHQIPERLKLLDDAGLDLISLYVGGKLGDSPTAPHSYDPAIPTAIAALKGRATTIELFVQGSEKNTDAQAATFVREIADLAKASGLRVVLYPHAGFYVDTLGDAVRIAKLSERENVGAMFNLCHFLKVEPASDLRATLESAGDLLWQASTNGADSDGKGWDTLIQPLDRGSFDQSSLLRTLRELDFHGPVGLQCYAVKGDPKENLKRSIAAWRTHLAHSLVPK